ncbi:MAG: DUF4199 domain-containing protein [Candidatus Cyclonatronum sp.]|uniref:DUF4199 domain-containing protein n=1 Tax=Cyclonatronum sp. TaxID=3024185 RepID=UPI0025BD73FF|nr:DUF4199 domain-containing protein [Cyclonatronum sp.]MCH8488121.1 DUF4199 domain-containing protein [Cyclonatronum sp.]
MKKFKTEIKWALVFVGMMLTWMVLERLTGLHSTNIDKHALFTNLIAIPAVAIYVLALLDKRKTDYGGTMSYKQGFMAGFVITAIVTLFSPLIQILISIAISPDYFANMIAYAVQEEKMTQQEAEDFFNLQNYLIQVLIGTPFMGLITTAVVASFTKKNSP